jgi:hypothetical protein
MTLGVGRANLILNLYVGSAVLAEISSLGIFKNGRQDGPVWKFLTGGSFMFGVVSPPEASKFDTFTTEKGLNFFELKKLLSFILHFYS